MPQFMKKIRKITTFNPVGLGNTRILTDYAQKSPCYWPCISLQQATSTLRYHVFAVGFITQQILSYLKQLVHKQEVDLIRDSKTPIYPPVVHKICSTSIHSL